jgi:hypothetical protein
VTLTAQVLPLGTYGKVMFMDGVKVLGIGTLNFAGVAQLTTDLITAGKHSLRAVYGGDPGGSYMGSQSSPLAYTIAALPGTGFEEGIAAEQKAVPAQSLWRTLTVMVIWM